MSCTSEAKEFSSDTTYVILRLNHLRFGRGNLVLANGSECTYRRKVIDVAVVRLVGAHHDNHILERRISWELPVVDGNGRRGDVLDLAGLEVLEVLGVGVDGLLLEVADDTVRELGGDEVAEEVGVEEDALHGEDERALVPLGLGHLHEGHEVHALVLRLLQQRPDPAAAVLEAAERAQVQQHAAHHPRHRRHRFQHHSAAAVPPLRQLTLHVSKILLRKIEFFRVNLARFVFE